MYWYSCYVTKSPQSIFSQFISIGAHSAISLFSSLILFLVVLQYIHLNIIFLLHLFHLCVLSQLFTHCPPYSSAISFSFNILGICGSHNMQEAPFCLEPVHFDSMNFIMLNLSIFINNSIDYFLVFHGVQSSLLRCSYLLTIHSMHSVLFLLI